MTRADRDPRRDQRTEDLFHGALEFEPAERTAWLAEACADDRPLFEEVAGLLAAHGDAPTCLDSPAWKFGDDWQDEQLAPGSEVGPYVIREVLGEGGMGTVYLAEQTVPLRRKVALKVIKAGMDTREVVARFQSERQALATLEHDHVAAIYDAGATGRGRPYFVMEYVQGERITHHCDLAYLTVAERIELFLAVCDAVQHAHQKGIVHRDLKPSNVLVTERNGEVRPKIIDFGVAKATRERGALHTVLTRSGQLIGTPEYMSPEQAAGDSDAVDTRSDIYSLGVMLYELLCGVLPFDGRSLRAEDEAELQRVLAEIEPRRPSTRIDSGRSGRRAALHRRTDPKGLRRGLTGDLDWIVMKALEKDAERRYASVAELESDLRCHLADEPVSARPPTATYRTRKFISRHRAGVLTSAVAVMLLFGMLVSAAWQALDRSEELTVVNERLVDERDQALADRVALEHEVDVDRGVSALPAPGMVVVLNGEDDALQPGELVEVVAVAGVAGPAGQPVLTVRRARAGSGAVPLGPVDAVLRRDGRSAPDGLRAEGEVPAGGFARVVTHGVGARLRVSGPVAAHARLAPSIAVGHAAPQQGDGPGIGFALSAWAGPGPGEVPVFVSVSMTPAARETWVQAYMPSTPDAGDAFEPAAEAQGEFAPAAPWDLSAQQLHQRVVALEQHLRDAGVVLDAPSFGSIEALVPAGSPPGSGVVAFGGETGSGLDPEVDPSDATTPSGTPNGPTWAQEAPHDGGQLTDGPGGGPTGDLGGGGGGTPPLTGGGGGLGGGTSGTENHGMENNQGGDRDDTGLSVVTSVDHGADDPLLLVAAGGAPTGAVVQTWADYDDDGLTDLLLIDDGTVTLLRQTASGVFSDVTEQVLLSGVPLAQKADWADADGDGVSDLLLLDLDGGLHLYRASGGLFIELTGPSGLAGLPPIALPTWDDVDGDEHPDLRLVTRQGGLLVALNDGYGNFTTVVLREGTTPVEPPVSPPAPPAGPADPVDPGAASGPQPGTGAAAGPGAGSSANAPGS